jgi:hypothetical protein
MDPGRPSGDLQKSLKLTVNFNVKHPANTPFSQILDTPLKADDAMTISVTEGS